MKQTDRYTLLVAPGSGQRVSKPNKAKIAPDRILLYFPWKISNFTVTSVTQIFGDLGAALSQPGAKCWTDIYILLSWRIKLHVQHLAGTPIVTKSPANPILQVLFALCKKGINWNMLSFFGRLQLFLGCGCSSRAWFFSQPCKKKDRQRSYETTIYLQAMT